MKEFLIFGLPVIGTLILPFCPRPIAIAILILDSIWVALIVAVVSFFNPEGPSWAPDTFLLATVAALPLLFSALRLALRIIRNHRK